MADNSEPNPTQTEVTSSEQLVGLVPIEGEEQGIGVHLISGENDEDFFGAQAIELNGERHVIVSQAQDPETGELLLVLRGENGEHIAIQSEALSSMVQASGGEHIQVAVETNEEASLTLSSDLSSISHSLSKTESNPLSTTSLSALPSIIANIPNSQTQTTTAPTNVVQAIDTPRVSQEEQPSTLTNIAPITTSVVPTESQPMVLDEKMEPTVVPKDNIIQNISDKKEEILPQPVIEEEKTPNLEDFGVVPPVEEKTEEKPTISSTQEPIVSQSEVGVKESEDSSVKATEISNPVESEVIPTEPPKKLETETPAVVQTNDKMESNENTTNDKLEEPEVTPSVTLQSTETPLIPTVTDSLQTSTSDQITTNCLTESITTVSSSLTSTESTTISSTVVSPEEKVSPPNTESVNSVPDLGFGNTAVIQVQDSGNDTSIEQLMANAVLTSDGNYVLMAQTEDGHMTGLSSELNLSDVINAGAAGGQTFLIETPEGLVACTASTSAEDGSIQLIPTDASEIESAVISSAQTPGTSVESQIIQAISGGQSMSYSFNSSSGCLELTAVNSNQSQTPPPKPTRGGRGSRSNKSKTVSAVPSMGQTLLLTAETETTNPTPKPSTQTTPRSRGGRGKGNRITGDSNDSSIVSNALQSKINSKSVTNEAVKSITTSVNSLTEVSAPPGPSQLAASRRTYSKKSNIVWITPDASQGANNTTFATVATASVKPSNEVQKQKATTNCNSSPNKSTAETSVSRVRTPSPTKTIMTSIQTTTATKSHAITSIRSASPTKTVPITLQTPSTINKTDSKTPSKTTVTTIANKSTPQTISIDKKDPTVPKISATHTATKTVTTSKTAAKGSTQTVTSRGQTPNLTIQSPVTPKESPTKTTIRMSDITATKTSVDTTVPKGSAKAVTVPSVPTVTKTRTPVMKSGAQTIASATAVKTTAPTSPTKTVTQPLPTKKTPIPISTSAETSVSSVKKPISNISMKSTSNPIIAEVKDTKNLENTIKESNVTVSGKPTKIDSTPKTVSTPIAVKSNAISAVSSTKTAAISAEKTNKKSTEKTISNRNVETRHSARLSPSKSLKPELNTKEIDSNTKLEQKSSDLIESKIESKSIETQNSKNKSEVETEDKNKSSVTQIEPSIQKPSKTEEKKASEADKQTTESTEEKSLRKSRRSSRNTTNTEENKKEVKSIEENKIIETKTKDTKEIKENKEKPKETQVESVSTRRTSRKRENTIDDKTQEPSKVTPTVEKTTVPPTTPTVTEVKPQRATRASTGKKTNPKQTKAEEIVSKTIDTKAEKEVENKVETKADNDFDRIVKETTPKEKRVEKTEEKSLDVNDNNNNNNNNNNENNSEKSIEKSIEKSVQKTDLVSPKTSETPSLTRSIKKRVQFEIKEKTEEPKVSKSCDSKEKVETPTSAATRRSLRSSTPQVVTQSKSEPKAEQKEVSDNNNETKSEKQNENNNNKTPQRFSTRKRKEVTKSAEIEVKDDTKGPKKSRKSETTNDIESAVNVFKTIDSTDSSAMSRSANRRSKSVKRFEPRTTVKSTVRHSIETDSLARLNRTQSSVHSFIDDNEWPQKEEEMRRKTISSLSDLRSPNECYDYSTNECSFYIRHQSASLTPKQSTGNYLCQKCGFHTTRINNLVIHHRDQCSYVKNQVIQQWQTELQKRVRPSDTSIASTSSPEIKRRKTDKNDELNNISDKNSDQSDDDSEDEEITTNDAKNNQNPTISDIDAMLMGSDDEDLLSIDNIEKPKRDLGFSEDDIVWVETNSTHWPAIVSKVFPKEKKAMIRYIDSPWSRKSVKADISSISLFDSAEVNKQYLREGRKASNGDLLVKAVQKAEEFLRKKCLGNELSAAKFFDQIDSDLSEANAEEEERLTPITSTTKDSVSVDFKETAKTSKESLLDTNKAITGSNGDDSEADQMPESNEAIAQWKEKRRQQNAKLLQCIKEGKVETHLLGVYRETIPSERHQKFRSGSETEKNQLKHVPWFGPIDDEEQQEEIYDYCSQLFKSNFKTDGSFDTVAYIFEVWVPEAIVKAISRVRRIELKDSEFIFAKGVILSKTEKDELTKEIQKEAEKQMTSQTSSD